MISKPNLLPPRYRVIRPISLKRVISALLVLTLVLGAGFAYYLFWQDLKGLEEQRDDLEQALAQLSPTQERMKEILDKQREIERMKSLNGSVKVGYQAWSEILHDVVRVLPPTVSFTALQCSESSLTIRGKAGNSLTVADYAVYLRRFECFAAVEINYVGKAPRGVEFILTATLSKEGGKGDVPKTFPAKPSA